MNALHLYRGTLYREGIKICRVGQVWMSVSFVEYAANIIACISGMCRNTGYK